MKTIISVLAIVFCLGMTSTTAWADDSARIRQLEDDVNILKQSIVKQGNRIDTLELQLSTTISPSNYNPNLPTESDTSGGWHNLTNWQHITHGMSERQVISILGQPTSFIDLLTMRTIYYRGKINGSFVSGNIALDDDRVVTVSIPRF
jgi:outer membrane protein assembly factor BamE (lipoprotein component of BamABCDE complex)